MASKILFVVLVLGGDAALAQTHFASAGGVGAGEGGFLIHSPDDAFLLNLRGYVQADERYYVDTSPATPSTFLLRRVRPVLEGTVHRYFGFKIMPDFAGSQAVIFDAFAELRPWPELALTVGKFKPPIGLERLQSARHITFIERALPTNLVPNRDVGAQIGGQAGFVEYALGVFDGGPDAALTDGDTNDDKDLAARIFLHAPLGIGAGVAASHGAQSGTPAAPNLPAYKSIGQLVFFSFLADGTPAGTVVASGDKTRISPQGYWYLGRFGLLAEYVWTRQGVKKGTLAQDLDFSAWQLAGSVVLGGRPTFDGVILGAPFDPGAHHYGAVEIKARYSEQHDDPAAFRLGFADSTKSAQAVHAGGGGVNWHLSRSYKIEVDFEYAEFVGGGKPLAGQSYANRASETSVLSRVQVAF